MSDINVIHRYSEHPLIQNQQNHETYFQPSSFPYHTEKNIRTDLVKQ